MSPGRGGHCLSCATGRSEGSGAPAVSTLLRAFLLPLTCFLLGDAWALPRVRDGGVPASGNGLGWDLLGTSTPLPKSFHSMLGGTSSYRIILPPTLLWALLHPT